MHLSLDSWDQEWQIMEKNKIKYILAALAVLVFGMLCYRDHALPGQQEEEMAGIFESASTQQPDSSAGGGKIYVHIVGAVKKPGVYAFDEKPRVVDVVTEAGGFTKDAVSSEVNQAEIVEDGSQVVIGSKRDKKEKADGEKPEAEGENRSEDARLDLNTATKEELMGLTGIGESKAMSIISYRETNGAFKKIEEIMNITGIKTGVFDKIKDRIKV